LFPKGFFGALPANNGRITHIFMAVLAQIWQSSPMEREATTMLGSSPAFGAMLEQVSRLAPLDRPALIIGERGTGKELDRRAPALPFAALGTAARTSSIAQH
jgi:transcriptional regulator with AAA-type ATPase domain